MQNWNLKKIIDNIERIDRPQLELYFKNSCYREFFIRNLINTIDSGIIVLNEANEVIFSNKNIYDVLGISSEKLSGKILYDQVHDSTLRETLKISLKEGRTTGQAHVNYPRMLFLSISILPILSDVLDPEFSALKLVIIRDNTKDINEAEHREHNAKLEALKLLTAGIAHEIGNPLSAITLHAQLFDRLLKKMKKNDDVAELKRMSKIISEESIRLKRIIDNFLKAVRPISLQFINSDITEILNDVLKLMSSELKSKNISIVKTYKPVSNTLFDPDQMRSVFINIIKNSIDAMPNGGTITTAIKQHGNWIIISLKDNGIGIENEALEHVFKPYYTTKVNGSGLGMLIMQRIVHAHSGLLTIQSKKNFGTELLIELPVLNTLKPQSLPSPNKRRKT